MSYESGFKSAIESLDDSLDSLVRMGSSRVTIRGNNKVFEYPRIDDKVKSYFEEHYNLKVGSGLDVYKIQVNEPFSWVGLIFLSGLVIGFGFLIYYLARKKRSAARQREVNLIGKDIKETRIAPNAARFEYDSRYTELRNKALAVVADDFKLALDNNKTICYGAVMDWHLGESIATVAAFQTGDMGLYISSGKFYPNAYSYETVRNAGLAFVSSAQRYWSKAKPADDILLPDKGYIKFYFLTNKGKFSFQDKAENINRSDWKQLFSAGQYVISQYRIMEDEF